MRCVLGEQFARKPDDAPGELAKNGQEPRCFFPIELNARYAIARRPVGHVLVNGAAGKIDVPKELLLFLWKRKRTGWEKEDISRLKLGPVVDRVGSGPAVDGDEFHSCTGYPGLVFTRRT